MGTPRDPYPVHRKLSHIKITHCSECMRRALVVIGFGPCWIDQEPYTRVCIPTCTYVSAVKGSKAFAACRVRLTAPPPAMIMMRGHVRGQCATACVEGDWGLASASPVAQEVARGRLRGVEAAETATARDASGEQETKRIAIEKRIECG